MVMPIPKDLIRPNTIQANKSHRFRLALLEEGDRDAGDISANLRK